jgi:hypothetical protein
MKDPRNNGLPIKNGNSVILIKTTDHFIALWQDEGNGFDMNNTIIPDTVKIRQIGFIID